MPVPSIFVSYAQADAAALELLKKHFAPLEREGLARLWADEAIDFGADWDAEITAALDGCLYAVPVLSAAFFASQYIIDKEVPRLLGRKAKGEVELLPIFWSPCAELAFQQVLPNGESEECRLSKWQGLGRPEKTMKEMEATERERSLVSFVESLRKKLEALAPSMKAARLGRVATPAKAKLPLNNLPASLGDLFAGRQDLMAELEKSLGHSEATALVQAQTVSGLGGVGKTRLALELAYRHASEFSAIFLVNADSPADLRRNLAALSGRLLLDLGLPETLGENLVVEEVRVALRERPGWLLILDNVDSHEAQDAVKLLLPVQGGQVLITSRLQVWPKSYKLLVVETLDPESAQTYLLKATPERPRRADDAAAAAELAEKLGYLPLALELTAAYVCQEAISLAELVAGWGLEEETLLDWYDPGCTEYSRSLAATWARTFEKLTADAQALLCLLGHLAPEPIPVAMLGAGAKVLDEVMGDQGLNLGSALVELRRYSLIRREGDGENKTVTIHRLVQAVARGWIPMADKAIWATLTVRMILYFAPKDPRDVRTWPIWDSLRPHATQALELAEAVGALPHLASVLMNQLGLFLLGKALYVEAEPLMLRALALTEIAFSKDQPNVATRLNNLAMLYRDTDRLAEAEVLVRRALAINETNFGPDHPEVALSLNNLVQLLQATGRHSEAEPLIRRALAIDENNFDPKDPRIAKRLNNLAMLLQDMGRFDEVEPSMRRALAIDEQSLGPDHPDVARDLNNLARFFQDMGRLNEAEPLMRRALAIFERSLGSVHPKTVTCRRNFEILLEEIAKAGQ